MNKIRTNRRFILSITYALAVLLMCPILKPHVHAAPVQGLVIFAIQTASETSAGDEAVVLMNIGSEAQTLQGMELQYQSTAGTTWSTKALLSGVAKPREPYVIATDTWIGERQEKLTSGMAGGGGHIRIVQPGINGTNDVLIDLLGYGTAQHPLGEAAPAPPAGQYLLRLLDQDDMPVNSANNKADFVVSAVLPEQQPIEDNVVETVEPSPTLLIPTSLPEADEGVEPTPTPTAIPTITQQAERTASELQDSIVITELFPNPALPEIDSEAEFVELYNASDSPVDVTGCRLRTGTNLQYEALVSGAIGAKSFRVLYAADHRMALGNTTGRAELWCADKAIAYAPVYSGAKEGAAWIRTEQSWLWTEMPTPGAENILQVIASAPPAKHTPTPKVATKTKASPTPKAKAAASKNVKSATKAASTTKAAGDGSAQEVYEEPVSSSGRNTALLASVGGIAILYAIYEYRHDIANHYARCRRYLSRWRSHR